MWLFLFQILLAIVAVVLLAGWVLGWLVLPGPVYRGPKTDHFDGKHFFNPGGQPEKGLPDVFRWMLNRKQGPWHRRTEAIFYKPEQRFDGPGLRLIFVNHSTFLLQFEGLNVLIDPVFSERVSPVQWAGPRRMRPPGIRLEDLPPIDLVLLSHNHYDHLDLPALRKIGQKQQPLLITAPGVGAFLRQNGWQKTIDLDWWEKHPFSEKLEITATPAWHFSGRGSRDRNRTGWVGFVLKSTKFGSVYFAGDSGYGPFFKEIGQKLGPFRLAMLPIGAYLPRWFMSPIHVSPDEAVQIFEDLGRPPSVAMHFGTFPLADDGEGQAETDLRTALAENGISELNFRIPTEGMPIDFD